MTYATLDLLIARYGERTLIQLTDLADEPTGEIVEAVVDRELVNTDAVINGFLKLYQLPLADTPPLLADLAQQIAIYKLHTFDVPVKIADDYKAAMATLRQIADGTVKLPIAGVEPAGSGAEGVQTIDRDRDFTPENMRRGFI